MPGKLSDDPRSAEGPLRALVAGTATITGDAYFHSLVRHLASALDVRCALVAELAEGTMAAGLEAIQAAYADIEIGSYPFHRDGHYGARLVLRGTDEARLSAAYGDVDALVRDLGAEPQEA